MDNHYNPFGDLPEVPDVEKREESKLADTAEAVCDRIVYVLIFILTICTLLFSSCSTTKFVPVERHTTDTVYQTRWAHDSIHVRDSIHVSVMGDTVRIDRWHTRWRDRLQTDTIYISKTDTVPRPYPVEVVREVERRLSWWQRTGMAVGNGMMMAGVTVIAIAMLRWFRGRRDD